MTQTPTRNFQNSSRHLSYPKLLINRFLSTKRIKAAGLFDVGRLNQFLLDYKNDRNPVSLVRKDALLNHILGLHILQEQFVEMKTPELALV